MQKAFITAIAGAELTAQEEAFLTAERPVGLILFARNCVDTDQVRALGQAFRACVAPDPALVLVDQEGGRVQRLRPPIARTLPPAAAFAAAYARNPADAVAAARLVARLAAEDLRAVGIDANCAPVLDVPVPGAHDIIGNRAYGHAPEQIIALGRAVAAGLMDGGVLPIMKHIPGHGRATADSHLELPIVTTSVEELEASDFVPFRALAGLPAAMTAHVVYTALDATHPASTSARIVGRLVRQHLGFDGLLISDDLSMQALTGSLAERTLAVHAAGCDLALHCNGHFEEMQEVAAASPILQGAAAVRFARALGVTGAPPQPFDRGAAASTLDRLLSTFA